jgi:PhnB protein
MPRVNTYLNFMGTTEEAFTFYAEVFNPDHHFLVQRFGDLDGGPPLTSAEKEKVLHVELPIFGNHVLMGTDMLESMGHELRIGNNTTISLEFDSRDEALSFYERLSVGATDATGMNDMPWGAFWGCCLDRFGIRWMFQFMESDPS